MILTISINKFWKDVWCPNRKPPSLFYVLVFFPHTQVNCKIFLFRMSEQSWKCMASCIQLSVYYKHSYSISTLMYRLNLVPFFIEYEFYYTNWNRMEILKNGIETKKNKLFLSSSLFQWPVTALQVVSMYSP